MTSGPNVRLGTNTPSMTSHWMRSTPASQSSATSSPSLAASAGRTDGTISGACGAMAGLPGRTDDPAESIGGAWGGGSPPGVVPGVRRPETARRGAGRAPRVGTVPEEGHRPLRLVLVDDHEMVLHGLMAMLAHFASDVEVVGHRDVAGPGPTRDRHRAAGHRAQRRPAGQGQRAGPGARAGPDAAGRQGRDAHGLRRRALPVPGAAGRGAGLHPQARRRRRAGRAPAPGGRGRGGDRPGAGRPRRAVRGADLGGGVLARRQPGADAARVRGARRCWSPGTPTGRSPRRSWSPRTRSRPTSAACTASSTCRTGPGAIAVALREGLFR